MVLQDITTEDLNARVLAWVSCTRESQKRSYDVMDDRADVNGSRLGIVDRPASPTKRRRLEELATEPIASPSSIGSPLDRLPAFSQSSAASRTRTRTRTRTPSPTKTGDRVKRVNLEFTRPSFFLGAPDIPANDGQDHDHGLDDLDDLDRVADCVPTNVDVSILDSVPSVVISLANLLSEETNALSSIPADLASAVKRLAHNLETIPAPNLGPSRFPVSITPAVLLDYAQSIHAAASQNFRTHESEAAWYPVVRSVLAGPAPGTPAHVRPTSTRPTFFTVEEAQTIGIHAELLPTLGGYPIPSVKVDHLLQFNRGHPDVGRAALNRLFELEPSLWASAFNDAVAGKTFTAAVVEVKGAGGDYEEGVYQFCVVAAAVFERLSALELIGVPGAECEGVNKRGKQREDKDKAEDEDAEEMPVVGWVVHGHFWYLHIAYRRKDGNIRVVGPFPSGNTATYVGIFRLMSIVRSFKTWAKDVYWPRLRRVVERRRQALEQGQ